MTEKPYVQLSAIEFQEVIKIHKENEQLKKENEKLKLENNGLKTELEIFKKDLEHSTLLTNKLHDDVELLKDDVYEEIDNALTVLRDLYEDTPLKSQKKMNNLYNRLESLRDDL